MAAYSLEQLLGYTTLTGLIQAKTPGLPSVLPDAFFANPKKTNLDSGLYTVVKGNRKTARAAMFGSPARQRELADLSVKPVKLMHFFEEIKLKMQLFMALRQKTSWERDADYEEITRQIAYFKQEFENTRKVATLQTLVNGIVYFDSNGNILPSSSGSSWSASANINANNQNQLNGIISTSWDNPAANIPDMCRYIRQRAAQLTGYIPTIAFYGRKVPNYLTNNNYVIDYMKTNTMRQNKYLEDAELPNLFGFNWLPAYEMFYNDDNDTDQVIIGDNQVVFCPDPSPEWWEPLEGSYPVPTNINLQTDAQAAMNSIKEVHGMFSYSQVTISPTGLSVFVGDTFLPTIKVPDAVFQATVVF